MGLVITCCDRGPMTPPEGPPDRQNVLTLELDGTWPAADLRRFREGVAHGLGAGRAVEVDLSRVDRLSSHTVATILWARRSCMLRNLGFSITGDRGSARRVLRSCGLSTGRTGGTW